jgi:twitching motility protein PilT
MQTFDQHLLQHLEAGRITMDEAMHVATSPHDFKLMVAAGGKPKGEGQAQHPGAPVTTPVESGAGMAGVATVAAPNPSVDRPVGPPVAGPPAGSPAPSYPASPPSPSAPPPGF